MCRFTERCFPSRHFRRSKAPITITLRLLLNREFAFLCRFVQTCSLEFFVLSMNHILSSRFIMILWSTKILFQRVHKFTLNIDFALGDVPYCKSILSSQQYKNIQRRRIVFGVFGYSSLSFAYAIVQRIQTSEEQWPLIRFLWKVFHTLEIPLKHTTQGFHIVQLLQYSVLLHNFVQIPKNVFLGFLV